MDYLPYLAAPVICAFIGWLTNYLAVKMLFYPRRPIRVLGFTIQGVFPKRQQSLAENIGQLVEKELISHEDVARIMRDSALHARFRETISVYIDMVLREKLTGLNPMLGMLVNGQVLDRVKEALVNEIDKLLPEIVDSALEEFRRRLDFKELAREKIETFSMDKLEQVLTSILHKEFKFIELVGAVLGLAIGVFQAALFYLY